MNLHGIVSGAIGSVNPPLRVEVRISTGQDATLPDGTRPPAYETPGSLVGSISGTTLTVASVSAGKLAVGQVLADGSGVILPGTTITILGSGTYQVSRSQEVPEEAMTTALLVRGQVQPLSWRDLQQLDGLNLGGVRWKIYLNGQVDAVVRPERKGGDLIIISSGRHQGTWLIAQVLEQWPDWVVAAIVLQNPDS